MKYLLIILSCILTYSSFAQATKSNPDHSLTPKDYPLVKIEAKPVEAKGSPNPQLKKIKKLLAGLKRLKENGENLRLIASDGDGTKHVLQTPTGKTISMNLETGDAELVPEAGLKKIIRILPTKGNSTIPIYLLEGIADNGKWLYKNEKGKNMFIESGVDPGMQKKEKPKFKFKLLTIDKSPLPDLMEDDTLPELCILPRKC